MATAQRQSEFLRRISLGLSLILLTIAGCLFSASSHAQDSDDGEMQNNAGFFILSDESFGSNQVAKVRLEVQDVAAVNNYGGVDIVLYRVPEPMDFLQKQKNLHRISVDGKTATPGIWNSLISLWDKIATTSRKLWRQMFTGDSRKAVVSANPDLATRPDFHKPTPLAQTPKFQTIPGMEVTERFRYPLQFAKDIQQPKTLLEGANVDGSIQGNVRTQRAERPTEWSLDTLLSRIKQLGNLFSKNKSGKDMAGDQSSFSNGNVYVPLGKLAPGLYLVEAMVDNKRAVTMIFISDTVAITKTSSQKLLTWTVRRDTGQPVADVKVLWSDGVGLLGRGHTDDEGLLTMNHASPEQTYVFGHDPQGGVFVSENYYYDSEIYNTKFYATTDRPLYRPGDEVRVKVMAREFLNARDSRAASDATVTLSVTDPNEMPIARQSFSFDRKSGGDTSFHLPQDIPSGGYELKLQYQGQTYTAAFRVSEYQKPHFEVAVHQPSGGYKLGEKVGMRVQLRYPDGKPVKNASVDVSVRSQKLSVVEGEMAYTGQFPIKLSNDNFNSDSNGELKLELPAAQDASRYIISILATDGAAYRVRHTQEILIDRAVSTWAIQAGKRFSQEGEEVAFALKPVKNSGETANAEPSSLKWDWIRLEDRSTDSGSMNAGEELRLNFKRSGSYQINLRNQDGQLLGATQHWVMGSELKTTPGHIEIVWDKPEYQLGETASALITFADPVEEALLTLERDSVERTALLGRSSKWQSTQRIAPNQWRVTLPVVEQFAPNITFSVAYVKDGQFVFENAGIKVAKAKIAIDVAADKPVYAPGEKVTLKLRTSVDGKPVSATVALGAVDEMVYVLQPEIAPNIYNFFYHPRRNNVRTQVSLSFIGYDLSTNQLGVTPQRRAVNERAIKVQERPRRDNVDTAAWLPSITTNAQGEATVSFTMPDALTRWRLTARAMDGDGLVGQSQSHISSNKDFYAKWTSPTWHRAGDKTSASIALFNQTSQEQEVKLQLSGAQTGSFNAQLKPGINFLSVPVKEETDGALNLTMQHNGKTVDSLNVNLSREPVAWQQTQSRTLSVPAEGGEVALKLPSDATHVRLRAMTSNEADFYRVADSLLEYPYGCAEQTASRLIPMALAIRSLPADDARRKDLTRQMIHQRLRLASMAGEQAQFGWWGQNMSVDPFLTGYAYYADWLTTRALGIGLPQDHWGRLIEVYAKGAADMSLLERAMMLDWIRQMGLPVANQISGLSADAVRAAEIRQTAVRYNEDDSYLLAFKHKQGNEQSNAMAIVLTQFLLSKSGSTASPAFASLHQKALERVRSINTPFAQALALYTGKQASGGRAILAQVSANHATIDRAIILSWLSLESAGTTPSQTIQLGLNKPWKKQSSPLGATTYQWSDATRAPASVHLPAGLGNAVIEVSYRSASSRQDTQAFDASIKRTLYVLERGAKQGPERKEKRRPGEAETVSEVAAGQFNFNMRKTGDTVETGRLYLEEVEITPTTPLNYVVAEIPLPPGGSVDPSTWGIRIEGIGALGQTSFQDFRNRYVLPISGPQKAGPIKFYRLLRFSQRGEFHLPPARVYNMYQPGKVKYDEDRPRLTVK